MLRLLSKLLSKDRLESIEKRVIEAAQSGDADAAWQELQPLLRALRHQREAALSLLGIVGGRHLSVERALEVLDELHKAHPNDLEIVCRIGDCADAARDIDQLNLAYPDHPLFQEVVDKLIEHAKAPGGVEAERMIHLGIATAARMMARQRDRAAEASSRRLVELDPESSASHYDYGLLLKTRGRFRDGMVANQTAIRLASEAHESHAWNLGICATGAGEGAVALDVWKRMGSKIEMGRFGLPEGPYPSCKVRLAERPLAERTADDDDPGLEETIWIERLSPCHGIIRSVLVQDLNVDYGDVVLIDGAPITYHSYGDDRIPVFPHLATLLRQGYQLFDFSGTQDEGERIAKLSARLERDAVIYSHSENFRVLCASCWRDSDLDHQHHETEEKHVVAGRIAAPADMAPAELLAQIDAAIGDNPPCKIYAPDLCEAAGLGERAAIERRRFEMLRQ
jgi:tetratricopeptide (TPR) repeat protein